MNQFVRSGIDVLSINQSEQLDMVYQGNYAYLAEETALKVLVSKSCELVTIKEQLAAVGYGIGLQKNSAYLDLFSRAYVFYWWTFRSLVSLKLFSVL